MNDSDRAVMYVAVESWEIKRNLANELRATAQALALNVYTEYSTVRGCSREAAYKEAKDQIEAMLRGARDAADLVLDRQIISTQ